MTTSAEPATCTLQSTAISTRKAREFVSAELTRLSGASSVIDDLGLVVSELVANAIQHGDGSDITVSVDGRSPMWFAVTVTNGIAANNGSIASRPPMDPVTWSVASTDQPSGRGLGIVRRLADEIDVAEVSGSLRVSCRRRR